MALALEARRRLQEFWRQQRWRRGRSRRSRWRRRSGTAVTGSEAALARPGDDTTLASLEAFESAVTQSEAATGTGAAAARVVVGREAVVAGSQLLHSMPYKAIMERRGKRALLNAVQGPCSAGSLSEPHRSGGWSDFGGWSDLISAGPGGHVTIHKVMEYTLHMQCIHSSQHGMHSPMHTCIMHTQMMFMLAARTCRMQNFICVCG